MSQINFEDDTLDASDGVTKLLLAAEYWKAKASALRAELAALKAWKRRALEAEELNRKFIAEINGQTHMGEPVAPAQSVPERMSYPTTRNHAWCYSDGGNEMNELTQAAKDVLAERRRQIEVEGWTPEHDDEHNKGELSDAAGCYALIASIPEEPRPRSVPMFWPIQWQCNWWKPTNQRRDLVKAGALILAEIERLDRMAAPKPEAKS